MVSNATSARREPGAVAAAAVGVAALPMIGVLLVLFFVLLFMVANGNRAAAIDHTDQGIKWFGQ